MSTNDYIRELCDFLDVGFPKVKPKNKFRSPSMLAELVIENGKPVLCVKRSYDNQADYLFSIAHEIRHLWQIENDLFDFDNYKTRDEVGIEVYNLQVEELDANAFAKLWMVANFKLEPQFYGLSDNVKAAINARFNELLAIYTG